MATESTTQTNKDPKPGNKANGKSPRAISDPRDVAGLVMMQIDNVNAKKDDLTTAIKGLADTAKQLVRAYAQQSAAIAKLGKRVRELEEKEKAK